MTRKAHVAKPASGAALALAVATATLWSYACDYPMFDFRDKKSGTTTTSGTGGTGAGLGPGGVGGQGGATTTSGTGNTGAGATGAAGPCDPRNVEACESGQKCTWLSGVGEFGCAQAGPRAAWAVCSSDADCTAGTWCDVESEVCKPFCSGVGDCPVSEAQCLLMVESPGGATLSFRACTSHCDPRTGSPCGANTNCVYSSTNTEFDCAASANFTLASSCDRHADCGQGMACPVSAGVCREWCTCDNTNSPNGCSWEACDWDGFTPWECTLTNPQTTYGGAILGICGP